MRPFLWIFQSPLFDAPLSAGGSGSGAAAGAASPSGGGAGPSAPSGGSADAGGSPFRLSDDALVDLGDGKPVKWSEARSSRFMDREAYNRGVGYLQEVAKELDRRQTEMAKAQQQQGRQPQPSPTDPFGKFRGQPVVDGDSLVQLAEQMQREGLGPLAQAVAMLAQRVQGFEQRMGPVAQTAQQVSEAQQEAHFQTFLTDTIGKLKVKSAPQGVAIPSDHPFVRNAAESLFKSYEQSSWTGPEFQRYLEGFLSDAIDFVKTLQQQAVERGKEARRAFFNPSRGNARPSGDAPYKHMRGDDLAAALFGALDNPT